VLQVGKKVGDSMTIRINTMQTGSAPPDVRVNVYLAYLKSYQHMGTADIRCAGGLPACRGG
jgi:hypothetical protein